MTVFLSPAPLGIAVVYLLFMVVMHLMVTRVWFGLKGYYCPKSDVYGCNALHYHLGLAYMCPEFFSLALVTLHMDGKSKVLSSKFSDFFFIAPSPVNTGGGGGGMYWNHSVRQSDCLSVVLSVCPLMSAQYLLNYSTVFDQTYSGGVLS